MPKGIIEKQISQLCANLPEFGWLNNTDRVHLAVLYPKILYSILRHEKTVESRFLKVKQPPFKRIQPHDLILFKESGGPIRGVARAAWTKFFWDIDRKKMQEIKVWYSEYIKADDKFWESKKDSKYGVLIGLRDVRAIEPFKLDKKDGRPWMVMDYDILCSR